jgi:hypothetical protein
MKKQRTKGKKMKNEKPVVMKKVVKETLHNTEILSQSIIINGYQFRDNFWGAKSSRKYLICISPDGYCFYPKENNKLVRVNKSNVFEKAAEWMSNNVYAPA